MNLISLLVLASVVAASLKRTSFDVDELSSTMSIDEESFNEPVKAARRKREGKKANQLDPIYEENDEDDDVDDIPENAENAKDLNSKTLPETSNEGDSESESLIDYDSFGKGAFSSALLLGIVVLLFFVMYVVSSDYLTPALAHLSAACKMSPDMAGLTFLAFGNGAPDLFTALSGAQEAPGMVISSSIGSGLFIFTVVFGLVICFASEGSLPVANAPLIPTGAPLVKIGRGTFWRNILMYAFCVAVLTIFVVSRRVLFWQASGLIVCFGAYLLLSIAIHYLRKARKPSNAKGEEEDQPDESMQLLEIERVRFKLRQKSLADRLTFLISREIGWRQMDPFSRFLWCLTSPLRLALCFTIMPLPDPTLLAEAERFVAHSQLLRLLLPLNPFASVPLMAWMTGSWQVMLERFGALMSAGMLSILAVFLAGLLHVSINSIVYSSTCQESKFTEKLPLYAVSVYSFACCIGWIYVASNELVAAILSLGPRLGVSSTIMGSLMLAWGNSIGDLIADLALARNGIPQTAITAIFSGPIQNVLLTLGISFLYASSAGQVTLPEMEKDVVFGLLVLAGVLLMSILMIPGYFAYRIPRWYGMVLIAIYIAYVPCSILLSL